MIQNVCALNPSQLLSISHHGDINQRGKTTMKVAKKYSHLNGEEWLIVHQKDCYNEILNVVDSIDAEKCRTKISKEKGRKGDALYSPVALNKEFERRFEERGWESHRYSYYVAHNYEQMEAMAFMDLTEQKEYLEANHTDVIFSYNQIDHVKNTIAVEVQFGKYAFVAYDIFVKHLAFYTGRVTNVGVEILPTKAMQKNMSSGPAYYEGEIHNILRHGRGSPSVPLMVVGIEPD